jgi:pantoate--beta-alanine ligase
MKIIFSIIETQKYLKSQHPRKIGFVPTMGALHEGHLALIKKAKEENEITVCSIFVNPTQFNNPEDLKKYPRTLSKDVAMLESVECDLLFVPIASEMYAAKTVMKFNFGYLENILEGKFRPGHFNGVGVIVAKLFNIVKPNNAYFGQKDIQQVAVVKTMVDYLNFDLNLKVCETIREKDGLAMSSRNRRLSEKGREIAPKIYESLEMAKNLLISGKSILETKSEIEKFYSKNAEITLEYFEIADADTLEILDVEIKPNKTALVVAAYLEEVRLIDNLVF